MLSGLPSRLGSQPKKRENMEAIADIKLNNNTEHSVIRFTVSERVRLKLQSLLKPNQDIATKGCERYSVTYPLSEDVTIGEALITGYEKAEEVAKHMKGKTIHIVTAEFFWEPSWAVEKLLISVVYKD